ncbi:MAG TPA: ROK family transcriptional regulator [Lacisediminihabitans sp.]|uniref:ROK family transcriptional regulator n=1 Tax=Lacisediminihabitans sp. TaxID=2787631 RepID=UPI002ED83C3F
MSHSGASVTLRTSKGLVLDLVRSSGPISRVELAERTGLTPATMTNVVRQLLAEGLVLETGRERSTGGKPRVLIDVNPTARYAIGVQLGADSLTYVVTNLSGAIVARLRTVGASDAPPAEQIARMAHDIDTLIGDLALRSDSIIGIGLVAPGPQDLERGVLLAPPSLPRWSDFPLRDALGDATGRSVLLDNDATAAAVGEFWGGAAPDASTMCVVYMGAGIGAGILIDGTVYRGASSNTGELGQLWIASPSSGARADTLERISGPAGVVAATAAAIANGSTTSLTLRGKDPFSDFTTISTAATLGDELAVESITHSAEDLAESIGIAATLLDLDWVILAGPAFAVAGSLYVGVVKERLARTLFARPRHAIEVRLSTHPTDAAAVGAAALVLQDRLAPRTFGVEPR